MSWGRGLALWSRHPIWRRLVGLVGSLLLGAALIAASAAPSTDAVKALQEGNRLFRNGQVEEAIDVYLTGWSAADPHPTLAYNLGAALHRLDRVPEAILWYLRAPASDDPWRQENLFLARRTLGSQVLPPDGPWGLLTSWESPLATVAIVLAWVGLLLLILFPKVPRWVFATLGLAALCFFVIARASLHLGPDPAVILEDCATEAGDLPAGTEAWAKKLPDGQWQISGSGGAICPAAAVELVFPAS